MNKTTNELDRRLINLKFNYLNSEIHINII